MNHNNGIQSTQKPLLTRADFNVNPASALLLLMFLLVICFIGAAGTNYLLGKVLAGRDAAALRIGAVVQDLILFIVPALATALIATRRPAALLCLQQRPSPVILVLAAAVMIAAIPALEVVIFWNAHLDFSFLGSSVEQILRSVEDASAAAMAVLLGDGSPASFIVNILIVGIAAGFSEELLFRGTIQRLLRCAGLGPHVAIWTTALVFSAVHMQFYGFVPRLLLGAYFGYLLYWSRSIWVPIFAHALNNTIYVITAWLHVRAGGGAADTDATLWPVAAAIISAALTTALLWLIYRRAAKSQLP